MASWQTSATSSSFDSAAAFNTTVGGRNRDTKGTGTEISFGEFGQKTYKEDGSFGEDLLRTITFGAYDSREEITTGYDMVGINGNKIEEMRKAIRTYVTNVQTEIKKTLEPSRSEALKAFRGEDAIKSVNDYIDKVKLYCENVTSTLLAFSDKLADIGNAWKTSQANIGSTVNKSSGAFSSGTAYKDEITYTR